MASKAQKAKAESIELMTELFGEPDRWGHFKMDVLGDLRRIKCQKISWRYETKIGKNWVRSLSSNYTAKNSNDLLQTIKRGTLL
jgi:hypothetical protein